jgi:hypothetical protein
MKHVARCICTRRTREDLSHHEEKEGVVVQEKEKVVEGKRPSFARHF